MTEKGRKEGGVGERGRMSGGGCDGTINIYRLSIKICSNSEKICIFAFALVLAKEGADSY